MADAGRRFAFIKATQGDYNTQTKFRANWESSHAAGMLRSPYHFFDATIDGVTQANHFLSVLADAGGLQPGDPPPMLDAECPTSSVEVSAEASCEYSGNLAGRRRPHRSACSTGCTRSRPRPAARR